MKWYERPEADCDIIISSRVRLARNLLAHPFPSRINLEEAKAAIGSIKRSIMGDEQTPSYLAHTLTFEELSAVPDDRLKEMTERHVLSKVMLENKEKRAFLHSPDESMSVMVNEEDHVRIQSIFCGQDLEAAYKAAARLDDYMAESLDYAFDTDFGYLTSCPTNTGTGMRASYMLHLPILEQTGNLKFFADVITKAGFTIRGTYGEGSEAVGSIYQISNQLTLGRSEEMTLSSLKSLAHQISEKERGFRQRAVKEYPREAEDIIYRAYGILSHARKISLKEGMKHLSDIRCGIQLGLIGHVVKNGSVFKLMTDIQPASLQKIAGRSRDDRHLDALRADYIRSCFI